MAGLTSFRWNLAGQEVKLKNNWCWWKIFYHSHASSFRLYFRNYSRKIWIWTLKNESFFCFLPTWLLKRKHKNFINTLLIDWNLHQNHYHTQNVKKKHICNFLDQFPIEAPNSAINMLNDGTNETRQRQSQYKGWWYDRGYGNDRITTHIISREDRHIVFHVPPVIEQWMITSTDNWQVLMSAHVHSQNVIGDQGEKRMIWEQ